MATAVCGQCGEKLREIDLHGKWLQGCLACNKWGEPNGNLWMSLPDDDLEPLGAGARIALGRNTSPRMSLRERPSRYRLRQRGRSRLQPHA